MELGIFKREKIHKVKARRHITFMIITDPTKKATTIKIPKWIRFPILILIVSGMLFSLKTLGYIETLQCESVINRYDIQAGAYTIEDKDQLIKELEMTNEERYEMLKSIEALEQELAAKYEVLNETVDEFDSVLNSTEKTTESQPSEAIVERAAEEIVDLNDILDSIDGSSEGLSEAFSIESFDDQLEVLNERLNATLENHEILTDAVSLLQEEAEVMLPYWEAYPSGFPCESTKITCEYGWRIHPITYRYTFHDGIDIGASYENVYATGSGVVTEAGYKAGYGYTVVIDHGYGYETLYAHNYKLKVSVGDTVVRGDLISISGDTGTSTGPHLHYEVHYNGETQDPANYLY
jgi:murein DD-endopeptidase MepM/ murein hydrolase activator NlpD